MANSRRRCAKCGRFAPVAELRVRGISAVCVVCPAGTAKTSRRSAPRPENSTPVEIRRAVRRRDGERCVWCGATRMLHVHHVWYRSQGGGHAEHNLITLCATHHERVHSDKGRYQPLLLGLLWLHYVEGRYMTVPQLERWLDAA